MLSQAVRLKGLALDFLFPQWCVGCGKGGGVLCPECRQQLEHIAPPICPKCGVPQSSGQLCLNCAGWQAEIYAIRSPFKFEGVMRQAIHQLKYRNLRALAAPLAKTLLEYLDSNPLPAEVMVPVPLHPQRLRERGYNQSSLLAHELGKITGLPVADKWLTRARYTSPQARTGSVAERRSNVAGAFRCQGQTVSYQKVLLIDDVATTGATLNACAAALKAAGAASVYGLALAREI